MFKRKPVISSDRIDFASRSASRIGKHLGKRRTKRDQSYVECLILTSGRNIERGVIVDFSQTGAKVRFNTRATLPDTVRVKAVRLKIDREARVVWQDFNEAGLKFQ